MKNQLNRALASIVLAMAAGGAFAGGDHARHAAASSGEKAQASGDKAPAAMSMTAGEVRKVDTEQNKVTLRHEPIKNLDMPAMTMVFQASKPEMLQGLKVGDKVRFQAESVGGAMSITHIEPNS